MKVITITDKTRIPMSLAIIAIGGGAWWLSALYSSVRALEVQVAEIKGDVKTLLKTAEVAGPVKACPTLNKGPYSLAD